MRRRGYPSILRSREKLSMTLRPEHAPGEAAPAAGIYEQVNIFGRPPGIRVTLRASTRCRVRRSATTGYWLKNTRRGADAGPCRSRRYVLLLPSACYPLSTDRNDNATFVPHCKKLIPRTSHRRIVYVILALHISKTCPSTSGPHFSKPIALRTC
jgi:hypothetical protein